MPDLTLGDYELDEDGNGDLVIKDPDDNTILTWDDSAGAWSFPGNAPVQVDDVEAVTTLTDPAGVDHTGELQDVGDTPTAHSGSHENGGSDEISVAGLSGDLADEQDPKAHASSHAKDASDELFVENIGATSTDTSQAFVPDGTGGVTTGQAGEQNVPDFTVESNSPFTVSGASTLTITLDSAVSEVEIRGFIENNSGVTLSPEMTVNSVGGVAYDYSEQSGTINTNQSQFQLMDDLNFAGTTITGSISLYSYGGDNIGVDFGLGAPENDFGTIIDTGSVETGADISSIEFDFGGSCDASFEVLSRNTSL